MLRFLIRKIPSVLLTLLIASVIAFALPRLAPGDPAVALAGPDASPATVAAIRRQLGLDHSLPDQYWIWIHNVVTGHLGTSYFTHRSVAALISSRLDSTIELALTALVIMIALGVILGVAAGSPRSRTGRSTLDVLNTLLLATPPFLTGLLLIMLFGITFPILPISGQVSVLSNPEIGIQYLILPGLALALPQAAIIARLVQTAMLQARAAEFIDFAVAKGASPWRVTVRHVLRNSLGTAIVAIGLRFGELLGGAVVIEAIFARNGLGALAVSSVENRDYLVVQVLILGAVCIAVIIQLLTEIGVAVLDPRVRIGD